MGSLLGSDDRLLREFNIRTVRKHLAGRGWIPDPEVELDYATLYLHPDYPEANLLLPDQKDLVDFLARMADLVKVLAILEDRSPSAIAFELAAPDCDFIKYRVNSERTKKGMISLKEGCDMIIGCKDSVKYAAYGAIRKSPTYGNERIKKADEVLKKCLLGQTEIGSFVVPVVIPMPHSGLAFDDEYASDPLPRLVTLSLMRSLHIVALSSKLQTESVIVDGVNEGISSNMCDSLLKMKPHGSQSTLDVKVTWSPTFKIAQPLVPSRVVLSSTAFHYLDRAAKQLRNKPTISDDEKLEGLITDLHEDMKIDVGIRGLITVTLASGEKLKVRLGEEDYIRACDAHRDRLRVVLMGKVSRQSGKIEMTSYRRFEVFGKF